MAGEPFVLGVDLDGVCGDYTAAFRAVVAEDRGLAPDDLTLDVAWDFTEWDLGSRDEYERLHRLAVLDHRILRSMPVIDGAADALWRLSDAGVWIRIITHRLAINWAHTVAVADTVEWLDEARIPYRDICFLGAKPEVEADLYVDDAPHNVAALRASGNRVVVFTQPHNRDLDGPRADDWNDVERIVATEMARRGLAVQQHLPGVDPGSERLPRRLERP